MTNTVTTVYIAIPAYNESAKIEQTSRAGIFKH